MSPNHQDATPEQALQAETLHDVHTLHDYVRHATHCVETASTAHGSFTEQTVLINGGLDFERASEFQTNVVEGLLPSVNAALKGVETAVQSGARISYLRNNDGTFDLNTRVIQAAGADVTLRRFSADEYEERPIQMTWEFDKSRKFSEYHPPAKKVTVTGYQVDKKDFGLTVTTEGPQEETTKVLEINVDSNDASFINLSSELLNDHQTGGELGYPTYLPGIFKAANLLENASEPQQAPSVIQPPDERRGKRSFWPKIR
jgi:pullulanase/glycogen debranching enzyme